MVRDHVMQQMQRDHQCRIDMARSLHKMEHDDEPGGKSPVRKTVEIMKDDACKDPELQIIQNGCNIKHKHDLEHHNIRKGVCEENKTKAHALIMGHCNKTTKTGQKRSVNFNLGSEMI